MGSWTFVSAVRMALLPGSFWAQCVGVGVGVGVGVCVCVCVCR